MNVDREVDLLIAGAGVVNPGRVVPAARRVFAWLRRTGHSVQKTGIGTGHRCRVCPLWSVICPLRARLGLGVGELREKGIWWMPWHREAMKDVARCEKPRGGASAR